MAANTKGTSPASNPAQSKVASACQRCRRQKLKCDVERPCTLCVRAGVECLTAQRDSWKAHSFKPNHNDASNSVRQTRSRKRIRRGTANENDEERRPPATDSIVAESAAVHSSPAVSSASTTNTAWNSSSTIVLLEEAFQHCDGPVPEESATSSLAAKQWRQDGTRSTRDVSSDRDILQGIISKSQKATSYRKYGRARIVGQLALELASILPGCDVVSHLVENYFDKIHWFTLVFHQDTFRQGFHDLYDESGALKDVDGSSVGRLSVLLAVCAISLEHLSALQKSILGGFGVDAKVLQDTILSLLRAKLLDMLSLGLLETAQACILLGTYYLNKGEPELAWPLCGCALRIAQALGLHRHLSLPTSMSGDQIPQFRRSSEARKRCWWAIYEFETLCSMIYGFPLSINDEDCDVEPLNPYDELSGSNRGASVNALTLLSYKCAMSQLSTIIRSVVKDLYGKGGVAGGANNEPNEYQGIIRRVESADSKISNWYAALPSRLKMRALDENPTDNVKTSPDSASPEAFENHLFHLQALTLKLAFENVRILIHRPLLSFKVLGTMNRGAGGSIPSPFHFSVQACRSAALQVSLLGSAPIFSQVSETYAAAFVSLHLLTAGVSLCIMATLDPLSSQSQESKMGVHRLMQMQSALQPNSIVAAQGLDILGQLMSLVMSKEMDKMFEFLPRTGTAADTARQSRQASVEPHQIQVSDMPAQFDAGTSETDTGGAQSFGEALGSQVVEGFDQTLNNPDNANIFTSMSIELESLFSNDIIGQDQGWIWGSEYGI